MTRGCGQVCKVMLAAQAQTQIQQEHGEISSLGSNELAHHTCCAWRSTSYFFVLQLLLSFLTLSLCWGGMRVTSMYIITIQVFLVVVPSRGGIRVFIQLSYFEETDLNCCSRADKLLRWNSNLLRKAKIMTGFPKPWGFTVFHGYRGLWWRQVLAAMRLVTMATGGCGRESSR